MTTPLGEHFVAALRSLSPDSPRSVTPSAMDVEPLLAKVVAQARAVWPGIELDPVLFVQRLAKSAGLEEDPSVALGALHAGDLYLALACAEGHKAAMEALDGQFLAHVDRIVAPIDASRPFADEVRQKLREKLLLRGEDGTAKIEDYTGRGPLGGWLRVAALRTALNLRRGLRSPVLAEDELDAKEVASLAPDPELDYLKARYRHEFREAFVLALSQLSPDERNVLRLHHLDGLSLEETALVCRVHRSTAARWLANARERILRETHRLLTQRLQLNGAEVASVLRLVQSQFDVSIHRYLEEPRSGFGA